MSPAATPRLRPPPPLRELLPERYAPGGLILFACFWFGLAGLLGFVLVGAGLDGELGELLREEPWVIPMGVSCAITGGLILWWARRRASRLALEGEELVWSRPGEQHRFPRSAVRAVVVSRIHTHRFGSYVEIFLHVGKERGHPRQVVPRRIGALGFCGGPRLVRAARLAAALGVPFEDPIGRRRRAAWLFERWDAEGRAWRVVAVIIGALGAGFGLAGVASGAFGMAGLIVCGAGLALAGATWLSGRAPPLAATAGRADRGP